MKIVQLMPTVSYGDAVSNDAIALYHILIELGYWTKIYAVSIDSKISKDIAADFHEMPPLSEKDVLLYHFSIGERALVPVLKKLQCHKVMIYHNITPAKFFRGYSEKTATLVDDGRKELKALSHVFDCALSDSDFNGKELIEAGYRCPVATLPIVIDFEDGHQEPSTEVLERYAGDDWSNLLFVGRIVPNKCQQDVIRSFAYYATHRNEKARLFLVGNPDWSEKYDQQLIAYARKLGVSDKVVFTGHVSSSELFAYYRLADLFLCMSEHEGFCVPVVEAIHFGVPVLAYRAAAVPETLGGIGVLESKEPAYVAACIDEVLTDAESRQRLVERQKNHAKRFDKSVTSKKFVDILQEIINHGTVKHDGSQKMTYEFFRPKSPFQTDRGDESITFTEFCQEFDVGAREKGAPVAKKTLKRKIREHILWPAYHGLSAYAPETANAIRRMIFTAYETYKRIMRGGRPQLLIDVTATTKTDGGTGIQRVVKNVLVQIMASRREALPVVAAEEAGKLESGYELPARMGWPAKSREAVPLIAGDTLFLLDSSWEYDQPYEITIDEIHRRGGKVYAVIYDLIPVLYPDSVVSEGFAQIFTRWHRMILEHADSILCISRSVADTVITYYQNQCRAGGIHRESDRPLEVNWFPMGSEIAEIDHATMRQGAIDFLERAKTTFLMVGTVEPRKGHRTALDAFERLLGQPRCDFRVLIIGHDGWKNDEIKNKIHESATLKTHVMWLTDATDDEVQWAYQHCSALIAASHDEGFGLPLVEAAHFGLPIICSDIPIFHEVTEEHATFFTEGNAESLTRVLEEWMSQESHPDSSRIPTHTWKESAQVILEIIDGKRKPYRVV